MKKQYTSPRAQAVALQAESMLAASMNQVDESGKQVTDKDGYNGAWTRRKRAWGKSSPWESDED